MQKQKTQVLNWYAEDTRMIRGLKKVFRHVKEWEVDPFWTFRTVRFGEKWAQCLKPGDRVAISISNDPQTPRIIGYAEVLIISCGIAGYFRDYDLKNNIGAKNWDLALRDMRSVYWGNIDLDSVVTVIELAPVFVRF